MFEHALFLGYLYVLLFSVIGHGLLFYNLIDRNLLNFNLGYHGIIGFFSIIFISIITSFFTKHGYIHNVVLHAVGLASFVYHFITTKNLKIKDDTVKLILTSLVFLLAMYIFKTHDDFPYYHLTYTQNLSENKFIIGTGLFSHGFRTFSSLFYFNSVLYLPFVELYLFHLGPFFILLFFNFILLKKIYEYIRKNQNDIIFFFTLLSFIFVNVAFYRISEHGTDRSAQILLLLIFIITLECLFNFDVKKIEINLKILLVLVFLAASLKAIYFIYLILIPFVLFKINKLEYILKIIKSRLIILLSIFFILNSSINILSTGCILYPAKITCFENFEWSIKKKEVAQMKTHYEWWAKGGGGPNYSHKLSKDEYVKNFNWISNWIDRHFFNKVSDTLLGILTISLITFLIFKSKKIKKKERKKLNLLYLLIFIFLIEWFLNHPAMRYGGYVLFAIPIFLFTSSILEKYEVSKKKLYNSGIFLIILTLILFNFRNIIRINKEIGFYSYKIKESPFYFIPKIDNKIIFENDNIRIYYPTNGMCWNVKTPCSYRSNIKSKNKFSFNIISIDDK